MAWTVTLDTANALVELDQVKPFVNVSGVGEDTILTFWINAASWFCNTHTRRELLSRAQTEYYNGDGTNTLLVNNYPITAITHVYDDLDRTYGDDTELDSDDLVYMPDGLAYSIVYDGGAFTRGVKNIKAMYTAGYATVPWELQQACLEIIIYYYKNTEENRFGVTTRTAGGGSMTIETTQIPKSALEVLDKYKRKW